MSKLNLLFNGTTVNLDFKDVILLLSKIKLLLLSMNKDTNNSTIFLNSVKLGFNVLGVFRDLLLILGECLLL